MYTYAYIYICIRTTYLHIDIHVYVYYIYIYIYMNDLLRSLCAGACVSTYTAGSGTQLEAQGMRTAWCFQLKKRLPMCRAAVKELN